ncbi:hypothetical protein M422DRAFT_273800 [Sphaerobolus stellatus SS14]|uniref:Uncharacterized protein n=1 Tax=Sphaerobolus stellatus (strain SS14) TaxID=990650 RepID=A0A0C9U865_SPHS4|nr:hypothetical protein M422DRAFT_273800 [Sphaerobolus stellatus SS14]
MASVRLLDMDARKAFRTPSTDHNPVSVQREDTEPRASTWSSRRMKVLDILEGPKGRVVDVDAHFGDEGQVRVDTPSIELASLGDRDDPDMSEGAIREMSEGKSVEGEPSYLDIANIVFATLVAALALVS